MTAAAGTSGEPAPGTPWPAGALRTGVAVGFQVHVGAHEEPRDSGPAGLARRARRQRLDGRIPLEVGQIDVSVLKSLL